MKIKKGLTKPSQTTKAESIRERIEELKHIESQGESGKTSPIPSVGSSPQKESPREFIARRMRELDQKKKRK